MKKTQKKSVRTPGLPNISQIQSSSNNHLDVTFSPWYTSLTEIVLVFQITLTLAILQVNSITKVSRCTQVTGHAKCVIQAAQTFSCYRIARSWIIWVDVPWALTWLTVVTCSQHFDMSNKDGISMHPEAEANLKNAIFLETRTSLIILKTYE